MASIYLIRHGQASFGADDYDQLSELGVQQAQVLGQSLKAKMPKPDVVMAGTMQRHKDTALNALKAFSDSNAVNDSESIQPHFDASWNEYAHQEILGAYDQRFLTPAQMKVALSASADPQKEFLEIFNAAMSRWMNGQHDGDYSESWSDFKHRLVSGINQLIASLEGKQQVLVFTSGGPISYLAQSYLGVPEARLMQMNWTLVNCGITKLVTSRNGLFVASLNEHSIFEQPQYRRLISYK